VTRCARVRREVLSGLEATARLLRARELSDAAVHDARTHLKRARAGLRLLRGALGEADYQRQNQRLRDAARPLTALRDAVTVEERLRALAARASSPEKRAHYETCRRQLEMKRRRMRPRATAAFAAVGPRLASVRARLRALSLEPGGDALAAGLLRTYGKARKAFDRAGADGADELLHEARKQAKYLFEELELASAGAKKARADAKKLSEVLGEDHDLANLALALGAVPKRIARERAELQRAARRIGRRLYREKTRRFALRLGL
jgi:CHAD domain-containing protein